MEIKIGNRIIGDKKPVFIVAELSANHNQNFDIAVKTIKAAKSAGADAIKLQTYTPDTITINCDNKYFRIDKDSMWGGKTLYQLYREAYTPWDWQPKLKKIAEEIGLILFSTPFDNTSVDFLEKMDVPCYKIASFEIKDIPLLEYIASKGKPILISTGIANLEDIKEAVNACKKQGNNKIILLKCTSEYPARYEDINLQTIPDMKKRFKKIIGLSDHTNGISVPIASVAFGAKIIEKHFILDKRMGGPDAKFSLEPTQFRSMVNAVREAEKSLGTVTYKLSEETKKSIKFSRSLFVVKNIKKGEKFTKENIRSIRPGYGLAPKYINKIIGKTATKNLERGTPLSWNLINKQ